MENRGGSAALLGAGAAVKIFGWGAVAFVLLIILLPFIFAPLVFFWIPAAEEQSSMAVYGQMPEVIKYADIINRAAEEYNLDPALLAAVIKQESGGNPNAVSPVGAQGLMQLMPATARSLGVQNPHNPEENIMGGAKYLRQLLDKFNGDVKLALAAYNAGPGAVERYGGVPPFPETQNYVKRVMENYQQMKKMVVHLTGGELTLPTSGQISSKYGPRWGRNHNGIDIAAPIGTPIVAAEDGTVIKAGPATGFGNWVVVDHGNGLTTVYGHMYARGIHVDVGDEVKRGQQIAEVGDAGWSTGPHLHFEVRINGKPVDPLPYLGKE